MDSINKDIPKEYHFLLDGRMIGTDTMQDKYRNKNLNNAKFNKCEKCGYDLLDPKNYRPYGGIKDRHPYKGYVGYYNHHKLILCDKCVDELNGQPWK